MIDLSTVRVLYRRSDTLTLYGIPYAMRPGQSPRDIYRAGRDAKPPAPGWYGTPSRDYTAEWVYLGEPGWWGSLSRERIAEVKAWLEGLPQGAIPEWPEEWTDLADFGR